MISIPKKMVENAKNTNDFTEIENYLMTNYPMKEIIRSFAEIYVLTADFQDNKPQITVTQAEYDAIMGLFKIKGQRIVNGEVIKESRGRPKKLDAGDNSYKLPV